MYAIEPVQWYYVNATSGTDAEGNDATGDGSASRPWRTLAKFKALLAGVSTLARPLGIRLAGETQESLTLDNEIGLTIESWPGGNAQGWISGRRAIAAASWSSSGGGVYTANIGAGKTLGWDGLTVGGGTTGLRGSVVVNYAARYDSMGHYGHYKWASGAGSAGQWDYDNTSGVLTIKLAAEDSDPRAQADGYVCYVDTAVNCLQMQNATRCTIRRLKFGPVTGTLGLSGLNYCLNFSGSDNVAEENLTVDGGYHGWGCVSGNNYNNLIRRNVARGMVSHSTAAAVTCGVVHSSANHVGNRCYGNEYHCFSYRYPDGTAIDTATSLDGLYVHTSGSSVQNFEAERERVVYYANQNKGNGFGGADVDVSAVPSDGSAAELEPNSYNARFIECRIENGHFFGFIAGAALVRCTFLLPNQVTTSSTARCTTFGFTGAHKMLMVSCHIAANQYSNGGAEGERSIFYLRSHTSNPSRLIAINCNFCDIASAGVSYWPRLVTWLDSAAGGSLRFIRCVLAGLNASKGLTYIVGDDTIPDASFSFTSCWYYGWDSGYANAFSAVAGRKNQTLWASAIDSAGTYGTNPNFVDASAGATPTGTGLATAQYSASSHPILGVNGRLWNGRYGAWQDGIGQSHGILQTLMMGRAA